MIARRSDTYALFAVVGIVALVGAIGILFVLTDGFTLSKSNLFGKAIEPWPQEYNGQPVTVAQEGETFYTSLVTGAQLITLTPTAATVKVSAQLAMETTTLRVGESTDLFGGITITLVGIMDKNALLVVVGEPLSCGETDGETPFCRGASACCGGACTELPDCAATKADGPVFLCGERQFYCCNGERSLLACGAPAPECVKDSDCPVINCVQAPCPVNMCVAGTCTEVMPPEVCPIPSCAPPEPCPSGMHHEPFDINGDGCITCETVCVPDSFFVMAVDDAAPTADVLLTIDAGKGIQELHPDVPVGVARVFSDVDGLALDNQVTLVVYHGEAVIVVGESSPVAHVTYAVDLAKVLDGLGVKHRTILSTAVPSSDLRELFAQCTTDSDCPAYNCIQAPCDKYVCKGGACILEPTGGVTA